MIEVNELSECVLHCFISVIVISIQGRDRYTVLLTPQVQLAPQEQLSPQEQPSPFMFACVLVGGW